MSQSTLFQYFKTEPNQNLEILICEDSKEATELESVAKFFNKEVVEFITDLLPVYSIVVVLLVEWLILIIGISIIHYPVYTL